MENTWHIALIDFPENQCEMLNNNFHLEQLFEIDKIPDHTVTNLEDVWVEAKVFTISTTSVKDNGGKRKRSYKL